MSSELRQPYFLWMTSAYRGMRALLDGRVEAAEQLAQETLSLGQRFGSPNALPLFAGQLFCVRREQGRLPELATLFEAAVEADPVFVVLRAALAAVHAAGGRHRDAQDSLARVMAHDLEDAPRDQGWLGLLSMLAATAVQTRDQERMGPLRSLLEPYIGRLIAVGHGSSCDGAVDHHLGLLAAGLGDLDAADAHLDGAATLHRRSGTRLWFAHTRREHAAVLRKAGAPHELELAHAMAEEARAIYAALGLAHWERISLPGQRMTIGARGRQHRDQDDRS